MEAGDSGPRHSVLATAGTSGTRTSYSRELSEQQARDLPNMATATLMTPAAASYHSHNSPFASTYGQPQPPPPPPPHSIASIMSHNGSRRTSNENELGGQRQSLPSLSEVFSNAKGAPYSPTTPTGLGGSSQSLPPPPPPPFSSTAPPPPPRPEPSLDGRSHGSYDDKYARFPPRPEGPVANHTGPGYAYGESREHGKAPDTVQRSGGHAAPASQLQMAYNPSAPLPPGQMPLPPAPPISPRHQGPPVPLYDQQRPPVHRDEEYGVPRRYDSSNLNRHLEAWGITESLSKIAATTRTIANFADAYLAISSEQHGGPPIPERLPTEREVNEMLAALDYTKKMMENVRNVVQHNAMEKAREGKQKGPYDEDEASAFGDNVKAHYGHGEVKKRRGRAAPPGRCHSCNRIDTPEWRRGPDGARTLCNACGLHYAKLERKRQMEKRTSRPKAAGE